MGDNVFIGANATILKGSTIGSRSILGAGSVLRGTIGDDELWLGNPAIFVKKLHNTLD
ncbi:MAG: DapH/DapD/GlmU-related protein [Patescibacteria group bacterium]